jgi:hypothetical protein
MIRAITVLIAVLALAVPVAASAQSDVSSALSQERYYSSYGEPESTPAAAPAADSPDTSVWKAFAIGAGGLVVLLGAAELVTLARLRRATAT